MERGLFYFLVRKFFDGVWGDFFLKKSPHKSLPLKRHRASDGFGFGNQPEFFENVHCGIGVSASQTCSLSEVLYGERRRQVRRQKDGKIDR